MHSEKIGGVVDYEKNVSTKQKKTQKCTWI